MSEFDPFFLSLGWSDFFQKSFDEHREERTIPGRVIGQERGHYRIQVAPEVTLEASISSKGRHMAKEAADFPAVGDWVTFTLEEGNKKALIHRVLERKSTIQRKRSGSKHHAQLIATNVDYMFIVSSLNEDFDLSRLGRYVTLGQESGSIPILLLTKSDLCANHDYYIEKFKSEFENIEVFLISNQDLRSIDKLQRFFAPGKTSVLLGSSGVGKSTLANYLLGFESQKTGSVSSESRGRHTTTSRNLLVTRWGGLVIDTPGMQEISSLDQEDGAQKDFSEIEAIAIQCKFTNCRHKSEPGCAIARALKDGSLNQDTWRDYLEVTVGAPRPQKKKKW